jgi:MYXO-CTERM domain-containing protein
MQRLPARRGLSTALALLCLLCTRADAGDPLKPYVVLQLDTSSSMQNATGFGPPSCAGSSDTRLHHAKCAINNIANAYGDMVLALARFRQSTTDNTPADGCTMSAGCPAAANRDIAFEPLVALVDGNNDALARWTDFTQNTCQLPIPIGPTDDPEIFFGSGTPIGGALAGAQRYFQGLAFSNGTQPWPVGMPGFDPIRNDPLKTVFLPSGRQCRPYIVISLTDGNESCGGDPVAAAAALLNTVVDGRTYRIETKAIGFDAVAPDAQIEGIAHAGGAPDVPGVNEGAYVQNEEQLQLAISQIIADAIRFEQCNELDDDCDILVDEDFPNKGQVCFDNGLGVCRGQGVYVCNAIGSNTTCQITMPGAMPSPEVCNNLDDNCNGLVDEGLICNCTGVELCNGLDDDCDLAIDEGLVRDCGTDVGVCTAGTETCAMGAWVGCTATGGGPEQCNGLDDDCDGVVDDLTRACSSLPGGNPGIGPCHPGTQICPPTGTGQWGPCLGEVGPTAESCDTIDNNCNGAVDEGTGGADCSGACGVGMTACVNGVIQCQTMAVPGDEICNDHDDDCDTLVDENVPDMGPCNTAPDGTPLCAPGVLRCVGGQYVCQGGDPSMPEVCDCDDNNCNGQIDEGNLCPGGSTCTHCQCAMPCSAGEFPCPAGRVCVDSFCLVDRCFNVTCDPLPNGDATECRDGTCVRACDGVSCGPGLVCHGPAGECRPDDCRTFPERCDDDEACVAGTCVADPCANRTCAAGEYCVGGDCVRGCSTITCPAGQRCRLGACETDPCGAPCGFGRICNEAMQECVNDPCPGVECTQGEACNPQTGQCHQDPCLGVDCPAADEVCREGTCDRPVAPPGDAGVDDDGGGYVTAGGGSCSAGGTSGGALALVLLGLGVRRRRPRAARR